MHNQSPGKAYHTPSDDDQNRDVVLNQGRTAPSANDRAESIIFTGELLKKSVTKLACTHMLVQGNKRFLGSMVGDDYNEVLVPR